MATLSDKTVQEIQRKANAGIPLVSVTPEKQSYYDQFTAQRNQQQARFQANTAQNRYNNQAQINKNNYQNQTNNYNNQINQARDNYYASPEYRNYNNMMDATINDIAKKYNFDFSREYANRQAEAEAQALRDANANAQRQNQSQNELNTASINANLMNMAEGLDRNYFQQMIGQSQNQVNSGLNAGIAADQDLRLQMARQAEMGGAYRDANLGLMQENQRYTNEDLRLIEALGTINQQAQARAESLYNDRLLQGYDILNTDRNFALGAAQNAWGQSNDLVNQYLNQQNAATNNYQWQQAFDYGQYQDAIQNSQADRNFYQDIINNQMANRQWQQQFDWNKVLDEANLTGRYNGNPTWDRILDEAELTGMFNGKNTWARQLAEAQLALQRQQLASGGSGGGRGSSSAAAQSSASSLANDYAQFLREATATPQNDADSFYMERLANMPETGLKRIEQLASTDNAKQSYMDLLEERMISNYLTPPSTKFMPLPGETLAESVLRRRSQTQMPSILDTLGNPSLPKPQ